MFARLSRLSFIFALVLALFSSSVVWAQDNHDGHAHAPGETHGMVEGTPGNTEAAIESAEGAGHTDTHGAGHGDSHGGDHGGPRPVFEPEHGTLFNWLAQLIVPGEEKAQAAGTGHPVVKYDYLVVMAILFVVIGILLAGAAKKAKIRPEGKPASGANVFEAAVDAFQDYLIGVMGESLARKYTPLVASFFFTILFCNWLGLIPGLLAPTAVPSIPIAMAIASFFMVHIIAIKEAGFKSWFMHFVGEPLWLAPLNFPLHLVGELIKPLSLSFRLLCNVFGEEQVVATLIGLSVLLLPAWLPIPFQLPMLFLGTFFGFLQALVFSTLVAIYIAILATHHDDHDEHNEHGHVEHDNVKGKHQIVAHPSEMTIA